MRELLRYVRVKKGRWYANFRHNGKHVGISLKAYQPDLKTALDNFYQLRLDLAQGKVPNGIRKKIKFLKPEKPFKGDLSHISYVELDCSILRYKVLKFQSYDKSMGEKFFII